MNDTIFKHSSGEVSDIYDDFFKWVPRDRYNASNKPDDSVFFALLKVDEDLIALHRATVLPPNSTPAVGHYVLFFDGNADVYAHAYGDDFESALADYREESSEDLFGEDQPMFGGEF
jgi:hypothetical protein